MSEKVPLITYNSLYGVLREEKKSKTLIKLHKDFYKSLEEYFKKKNEIIQNYKENKDKENLVKEKKTLKNSKKIFNDLISLRLQKISVIVIQNEINESEILDPKNIECEEELTFYNDLRNLVKKFKENNKFIE